MFQQQFAKRRYCLGRFLYVHFRFGAFGKSKLAAQDNCAIHDGTVKTHDPLESEVQKRCPSSDASVTYSIIAIFPQSYPVCRSPPSLNKMLQSFTD